MQRSNSTLMHCCSNAEKPVILIKVNFGSNPALYSPDWCRWTLPSTRRWWRSCWRAAGICCWSWSTPTSRLNPTVASTTSSTITPTPSSWPNCMTPAAPSDPTSPRSAKDWTNWWRTGQYDIETTACRSNTGRVTGRLWTVGQDWRHCCWGLTAEDGRTENNNAAPEVL